MSNQNKLVIHKASEHNLKNISLEIPKNALVVITGPSGSGKSSLAFDTIYVEGQRRYIESLSSYARQFLGQYSPPEVESITGLSPAVAIDQKTSSKNPRSTVGTVTEIFDYLRILFARIGTLYCPETNQVIRSYTPVQITKELLKLKNKCKLQLLAPINFNNNSELLSEVSKLMTMGFSKARINGEVFPLDDETTIPDDVKTFEVIVDRMIIKEGIQKRVADSVEQTLKLSDGKLIAYTDTGEHIFCEKNLSPTGKIYPDLEPKLFSFNSPVGACEECNGLGELKTFNKNLMILDENLSILSGAITPLARKNSFFYRMTTNMAEQEGIDLGIPYKDLPEEFKEILFYGTEKIYRYSFTSNHSHFEFQKPFKGIFRWLNKKYYETSSEKTKKELATYMNIQKCPSCNGRRLNQVALSVKINDLNIMEICSLSIEKAKLFLDNITLEGNRKIIADKLLKEIVSRITFLINTGLDYLTLDRASSTISGGEGQRIRLATQIGSALTGVLYVLDEPSIGLHQRDNQRLISALKSLRDTGNTVLVVEHDEEMMRESDHIIDMGPGAGIHGGSVIAQGPIEKILKCKKSKTANFLSKREQVSPPKTRREFIEKIALKGAKQNNIENLDVDFPLNSLVCVTGLSGSGKSTLVHEILVPAVKTYLAKSNRILYERENFQSISGASPIKTVIELDQSPIGRTPHSNPATYAGLFDDIRKLYSETLESKARGYKPGRFSFNVKGGRCEECEGNGVKKIEMHFLPDVFVTCSECNGKRYNPETLSVLYKGKNISEILDLTIEEARDFFKNHTKIFRILDTLFSVGLGYMKLGQPATTLSGGEAQRLRLSRELAKRTKGHCLYVLDEPTTGLHFSDIELLMKALQGLVDKGNSMIIIEHNLDVIKCADQIIDMGPEGGERGGKIIATGTPEEVSKNKKSYTGKYLKELLKK